MNKISISKYFYYFCLLISILLVLYAALILKPKDNDTYLRNKYLIYFLVFAFFLSLGTIIREFFLNKSSMKLKIIIGISVFIIGSYVIIFIKTLLAAQLMMYVSFLSSFYIIIPNKKILNQSQDNDNKKTKI